MNADGSGAARLTDDPADDLLPSWSPDGSRVAFVSVRDGNLDIYAMNADGSGAARLTDNPADDLSPSWSPDGSRVAFASNRDGDFKIYAMNADGSGAERLADGSGGENSPSWGPAAAAAEADTAADTPTPQPSEPPTPTLAPDAPTPTPQPSETPTPAPDAPTATPQPPQDCQIRQGMQARLQSVRDTITENQDGHVEVSFRNPVVNDCVVDAELRVSIPTNIIISSKDGGSGTAGTLNLVVSDIKPNLERSVSMDFKCLARGNYTINFSGSYWPSGDKGSFQPITLQQGLTCEEPSGSQVFPTPPPDAVASVQETATTSSAASSAAAPPPASLNSGGADSPNTQWLLIGGVGLAFALIVIVAIVALGRRG